MSCEVVSEARWVEASARFVLLSKRHEYWRWPDRKATYTDFKKEMWVHVVVSVVATHAISAALPILRVA
jgi:hypothetical protein